MALGWVRVPPSIGEQNSNSLIIKKKVSYDVETEGLVLELCISDLEITIGLQNITFLWLCNVQLRSDSGG